MSIFKRKEKVSKSTDAEINAQSLASQQELIDFLGLNDVAKDCLGEATYFACMKALCEAIGKLPLKLQKKTTKNGVVNLYKNPLYNMCYLRPNKYTTATNFWSSVEYNRNHYGNAYVLISGAGETESLWILPSKDVQIWKDDKKILGEIEDIYYIYSVGGKRYMFGSEEILHFKTSNTFDGIVGIPIREQLAMTIQGSQKAQAMVNKMYDSGFTAKAVLQYTGSLNDENTEIFTKNIENYAKGKLKDKGVENIIPIPLGTSLTPLNVKLADNQFIDLNQFTALQIASCFGIKPYQIGNYDKSSYASAEAQQLSFLVDTLLYIIKQYEEELTYKLLLKEEWDVGCKFKFNVAVMLRADSQTQIETLSKAVGSSIYTPNEARAFLDLESKDGGDKLIGNGAYIPVEMMGSQYTNVEDKEETQEDGQEE